MDTKQGTELAILTDDVSVSAFRLEELLNLRRAVNDQRVSEEVEDISGELCKISKKLAILAASMRAAS